MPNYQFSIDYVPPVAKRGSQVLIAIFSSDHTKVYLSRKPIYPPHIYRLFGGGIESNELPLEAVTRELREETGLNLPAIDCIPLGDFVYDLLENTSQQQFEFKIYLYAVTLPEGSTIHPGDDVAECKEFTQSELTNLIFDYRALPNLITENTSGGSFSWSDYAKIFAPVHQAVLDYWLAS